MSFTARQSSRTHRLGEIHEIMRDAAVDYHLVTLDEPYDEVLARFLLGRTPKLSR